MDSNSTANTYLRGNNLMNNPVAKYRPVLTAQQILHLLNRCKLEQPLSELGVMCISTLSVFKTKIENAGIQPAYIQQPDKPSTMEQLGAEFPSTNDVPIPKEQAWFAAYEKYKKDPESCSLREILDAREHMYLNDLMTPEEVIEFERKEFKILADKREEL